MSPTPMPPDTMRAPVVVEALVVASVIVTALDIVLVLVTERVLASSVAPLTSGAEARDLHVPPGFDIEVWATGLPGARSLAALVAGVLRWPGTS